MNVDLTIKNYRCFSQSRPIRLSLQDGVTAFVGPNNAGKSSLLRFFYEFRKFFQFFPRDQSWLESALTGKHRGFPFAPDVKDYEELFCDENTSDMTITFEFHPSPSRTTGCPLLNVATFTILRHHPIGWRLTLHPLIEFQSPFGRLFIQDDCIWSETHNRGLVDISNLLDVFKRIGNTLYIGSFRNAIDMDGQNPYYGIMVGRQLVTKWDALKNGLSKTQRESANEVTEEVRRVFGFRTLEINCAQDGNTLMVVKNGKSYALHDLGAGLAHFIIVLIHLVSAPPEFLLIDEPETSLHPTLQLDFLTTLASYAKTGVLFATHSIGLARQAADLTYCVHAAGSTQKESLTHLNNTRSLPEFLGEMSFSGYRELGFNRVLLVEGPTDVKTFQQFLRLVGKEHETVVLSLGGGSLINGSRAAELAEVSRITDRVFAVIDSEKNESDERVNSDRIAFKEVCDKLGFKCLILSRRATENYFSDRAVKAVKGEKYCALSTFQPLTLVDPCWGKNENWLIARAMQREEINGTDLGGFLASI